MNFPTILLCLVIAALFISAIIKARKTGGCSHDCASCRQTCSQPAWLEAYYKDHPESRKEKKDV